MKKKKKDPLPQPETTAPAWSSEVVAQLAYSLWEADGRPEGADIDYWLRAERELSNRESGAPSREEGAE